MNNKIWTVRGRSDHYSDAELIKMIKEKEVDGNDFITNTELKTWMRVIDTIYQFYLEEENENL
ncbi:MAG: hypothetical protein Q4B60_00660 [Erysipelotrichaceae bacterium]|nr:hypothetical protein [Erysipelotrichaceae bacterium]